MKRFTYHDGSRCEITDDGAGIGFPQPGATLAAKLPTLPQRKSP